MIRFLLFVCAILVLTLGVYLVKKTDTLLPLMNKDELEENRQFLHHFGEFYILLSAFGFFVAFVDLTSFSLFYIFGLLIISALFALLFAKKIQ